MKTIFVGKGQTYQSINFAIQSINEETTIVLTDSFYYEKVVVDKPNITIDGQNKAVISYDDYAKKIHKDGTEYVTFRTYTMLIKAPHITLKNLTIENSAGEGYIVGQAVALHLYNDDITCINCHLKAKQDTLFCGPLSDDLIERYIPILQLDEREYSTQFYHSFFNCTIEGTVDFIFGGSNAIFKNCTIISLPTKGDSFVVAPNHNPDNKTGFVFENCRLIKAESTKDNSVFLARPWRDFGFVTFKNCYLDSHIKKEGFSIWENTDRHLHARFYEIDSTGPGKNNENRVAWSFVK